MDNFELSLFNLLHIPISFSFYKKPMQQITKSNLYLVTVLFNLNFVVCFLFLLLVLLLLFCGRVSRSQGCLWTSNPSATTSPAPGLQVCGICVLRLNSKLCSCMLGRALCTKLSHNPSPNLNFKHPI